MTYSEALKRLTALLFPPAGEEARREADLLLAHCLNVSPGVRCEVGEQAFKTALVLAQRREKGEPLQYILGEWEFMGLPFKVGAGTLIPRPETELICELALREDLKNRRVLDLCCGSGCIGVSLSRLGGAQVTFSDISPAALAFARENAALNDVCGAFLEGDLFAPVRGVFDLITVNPPYLTASEMAERQKELTFEPDIALFGGEDGLAFYRRLAGQAPNHLAPGGRLLMEIGSMQGEAVSRMFTNSIIHKDLAGLDRVVEVRNSK